MRSLSKSEHEGLRRAISDAESRSGAHLALVVVPVSDRHFMYPLAFAALIALAVGAIAAIFWPLTPLRVAFMAEAAVFVALSLLFDWLPLRLLLVPAEIRKARARNLAHREFAARILGTHRGGILLFVSLAERYVELIADRELHARVGQPVWDRIVSELTADTKTGSLPEALLKAVAKCAAAIKPD